MITVVSPRVNDLLNPIRIPMLEYQLHRRMDGNRTAVGGKR